MPQSDDRPDVILGFRFKGVLGLQATPGGIDRPIELLVIRIDGIDEQLDLGLRKDDPLELVEQRRLCMERTTPAFPLVFPLRLDHQRRREERYELGERVAQRFDPLLSIARKDGGIELASRNLERDEWPHDRGR